MISHLYENTLYERTLYIIARLYESTLCMRAHSVWKHILYDSTPVWEHILYDSTSVWEHIQYDSTPVWEHIQYDCTPVWEHILYESTALHTLRHSALCKEASCIDWAADGIVRHPHINTSPPPPSLSFSSKRSTFREGSSNPSNGVNGARWV